MKFRSLLALLWLVIGLSSSGCALITSPKVPLPVKPAACDLKGPELDGTVTDHGSVDVPIETAIKLRGYLGTLKVCVIERDGHIEKLENRLRALQ